MKRIARLIGLFSILLLLFVVALAISQRSLHRQTERLRSEAIEQKRNQLTAALELAGLGAPPWSDSARHGLERTLDAWIRIVPAASPAPSARTEATGTWQFMHEFGSEAGADSGAAQIEVEFTPPPAARMLGTYQRVATILLNLALAFIVVFSAFVLWSIRTHDTVDEEHALDRENERAGFQSLHQLASVSARQSVELEQERAERLRVEEDLNIKQLLLNRALEQRIRLGQDLHDGIIQSLYATGLTLEAARALLATEPAAAAEKIAGTTRTLNATIREVRAYINGLSPDTLRRQTFAEAVGVLTRDLAGGRAVEFVVSIDEPTASGLPAAAATDLLQIVRESVSNSLRHGSASRVSITLAAHDGATRLEIQDNGSGLAATNRPRTGHGLNNIEIRIQRHGGDVSFDRAPGSGTLVRCVLPPRSTSTA